MNKQPFGEIILYQRGDAPAIDVRLDGDTVWLSLNQIADLLGRDKSTISRHIANVFAEGELEREAVVAEIATTAADGKTYRVEHFNLDVVISVGYRVKPFMGLLSFSGSQPTKAEVGNAKNYLDANELKRLNALVSAYFDAAEFRAMNHEPTYMKDWLAHLTQLITAMGGKTLQGAGTVSHQDALARAEAEYAKFRIQQAAQPSEVETVFLETVKQVQKKIEGKSKPAPRSKKGQRDE